MKVDASIGSGPWGPWYEVRSEGDLIVWSVVEGGDERRETVDPGPAGRERFWNAIDAAGAWRWKERYEDLTVLDGTSWSLRLEHGDRTVDTNGSNAVPAGWESVRSALEELAGRRDWR
jgi:hypothetical protein